MNERTLLMAHGLSPLAVDRALGRSVRITWIAADDGVGHAKTTRGAKYFACGKRAFDERYAWSIRTKCSSCLGALYEEAPSNQG